ncbi:MAG: DUF1993 domain-containing protein [Elsteraceae bacterium]
MTISMYQASVPVFQQGLAALSGVLDKAAAHAAARKIDPAVLLQTRLFPDMFPLSRQVQIAADFAKGCPARLAGVENPSYADEEKTIDDLKARLDKVGAFLKTLTPAQIDGSETRDITLKIGGNDMTFKGQTYLLHFALPNFYFHSTAAYAILRSSGVEIGKRDFIGQV